MLQETKIKIYRLLLTIPTAIIIGYFLKIFLGFNSIIVSIILAILLSIVEPVGKKEKIIDSITFLIFSQIFTILELLSVIIWYAGCNFGFSCPSW